MRKLSGVITAMTTPFREDGSIDYGSLRDQVDFLIQAGVDCLYPAGTTGEMLLCSVEERKQVAEAVIDQADGRVPVYIHVGCQTPADTIALAHHAVDAGADGIGVVTPMYFSLTDRALISYYESVCGEVPEDFPVYAYAIPQLAGNDLSVSVVREIRERCNNLVGIKYSYPNMTRIAEYLAIGDGFSVLPGADHLFLPALALGCDGVVSGCSGPQPEIFVAIKQLYDAGDLARARQAQLNANRLITIMRAGADISIFKYLLTRRGIAGGVVRPPLVQLPREEYEHIYAQIEQAIQSFSDESK